MSEMTKGTRVAILAPLAEGRFSVWVGYRTPSGDEHPALWFKGYQTCGAEYASEKAARKAAQKFLDH